MREAFRARRAQIEWRPEARSWRAGRQPRALFVVLLALVLSAPACGEEPLWGDIASTGQRLRRLTSLEQIDWMGIIGLHYHWMDKDDERGRTLPDSGGSVLSAEIGLVGARRYYGARLGVLLPLHTDLGLAHAPIRHEIQASFRASF
jgi:hypothetical protein